LTDELCFGNAFWPDFWICVVVFAFVFALAQGLQVLFHNRVWIEKLGSGQAWISLTT
jgi:hypothetical protein